MMRLGLGPDRPWYNANQDTPKLVPLPRDVQIRHASAGGCHSLAVATDGALYSFGCGGNGRLGLGDSADRWEPTLVSALEGTLVRYASAGLAHSVVHTEAGGVLTFGSNHMGCSGHAGIESTLTPRAVAALSGQEVEEVATGASHTVVRLASGEMVAFGSNEVGQLGSGDGAIESFEPVLVALPE